MRAGGRHLARRSTPSPPAHPCTLCLLDRSIYHPTTASKIVKVSCSHVADSGPMIPVVFILRPGDRRGWLRVPLRYPRRDSTRNQATPVPAQSALIL